MDLNKDEERVTTCSCCARYIQTHIYILYHITLHHVIYIYVYVSPATKTLKDSKQAHATGGKIETGTENKRTIDEAQTHTLEHDTIAGAWHTYTVTPRMKPSQAKTKQVIEDLLNQAKNTAAEAAAAGSARPPPAEDAPGCSSFSLVSFQLSLFHSMPMSEWYLIPMVMRRTKKQKKSNEASE